MKEKTLAQRVKGIIKKPIRFMAKDWSLGVAFPHAYRKAAEKSSVVSGKVLLIADKGVAMPDAFRVLYEYLEKQPGVQARFIGMGRNERIRWVEYYRRCLNLMEELATAQFVFLEDASDVISCIPLRPETHVVQLWHACGAFKKWGMSTAELEFGDTRKQIERHPFYENLSLVTVSSSEVTWAYREAMKLESTPEVVQATGVSRTDVFFDKEFLLSAHAAVLERVPQAQEKKILLYAPTFRGHVSEAVGPDALDIDLLREQLAGEWVLLIKHHPFVKEPPAIPDSCAEFAFMVPDVPTDYLMSVADVMVTDYSSVVFEYSLFERPMAFFAYDIDDYNDWRGFYYPYDEMTPGPVTKTTEELADYIANLDTCFDVAEVQVFREKFMSACDGHATERIWHTCLEMPKTVF